MTQPTAMEQEMLYYLNRMRTNPSQEYNLLVNSQDVDVISGLTFFNVNLLTLQSQWSLLSALQPLAWSEQLGDSSQTHSSLMIQFDQQSHNLPNEPNLGQRITNTGYVWNAAGENVYAFAKSVFHGHAGFAVDWGDDDNNSTNGFGTGIQNPPDHRENIMNPNFREIGIDITIENNINTTVGPFVITQHFGNRTTLNNKGWLMGSAFRDLDGDNFYDAGEGLNNVIINITGINGTNFSNTFNSWEAGGYQILLNPGNYQAQFTWEGNIVKNQNFTISSENVLIDLLIEAGPDPVLGKGKIIGNIFNDVNKDHFWNSGELGVSGWTVFLDTNNNKLLDVGEISKITDAKGEYIFNDLNPGTYNVVQVLQNGWTQTYPDPNNPNGNETYKLDDSENDGWTSFGPQDHLIFNRFESISGLNTIGSISIGLSSRGNPSKIFIYQDGDNDDTPDGGEKILEVNTNLSGSTGFTTIDIPDTLVNGTFFIAAVYRGDGVNNNWIIRDNDNLKGNSFIALANAGTLNPSSFSAFASSNNWLLRGNAISDNLPQIVTVSANKTLINVNFGNFNQTSNILPTITLAITPTSVVENGTTNLVYTFTRSGTTTNALTVNYSIGGTATSNDYTGATPGSGKTITFPVGSNTQTLIIDPTGDTTIESNETVALTLASNTAYTVANTTPVTGTITNDDLPIITLAITPTSVVENGTTNLVYTFTRSGATTNALNVNYSIGGTATSNDYTGATPGSGKTITFPVGSNTQTLIINPTGDTTIESNETVTLTLASNTAYTVANTTPITGTIINDDVQLSINNIIIIEGQESSATLTVSVNSLSSFPINVNYTTSSINATANIDYISKIGTLTIPPNTNFATVSIPIVNDNVNEEDESFIVSLSNPVNGILNIDNSIGEVTITDTLPSRITRTLPSNVENLALNGSTAINGTGNIGNNLITGNSGNNILNGNSGNDSLTGGLGNDTLIGELGNDTLTGGAGNDVFRFNSTQDKSDRITDFNVTEDTIIISASGFNGALVVGTLPSNRFTINSSATTSTHRFIYNSNNGDLFFDIDGSGTTAAIQIANLNTGLAITNLDIVIVA